MRAAVVGSGAWGTTFAAVLADAGTPTTVRARREEHDKLMEQSLIMLWKLGLGNCLALKKVDS